MTKKIMANLPFKKRSLIEEMILKLSADDPDFGKARNNDPSNEFAFELRGDPIVPSIQVMSEGCRNLGIYAINDYGEQVTNVPIGVTSNAFFFDLVSCKIELKTEVAELPLEILMHSLSCGIINLIDNLDIPPKRKKKLKSLRMSRFYYGSSSSWWTFTHS